MIILHITVFPGEYELNKCHTSDCKPCEERFVSCVGKPDGANSISGVELSAHYAICEDGRTITQEVCHNEFIFSPVSRTCIQVDKGTLQIFLCILIYLLSKGFTLH